MRTRRGIAVKMKQKSCLIVPRRESRHFPSLKWVLTGMISIKWKWDKTPGEHCRAASRGDTLIYPSFVWRVHKANRRWHNVDGSSCHLAMTEVSVGTQGCCSQQLWSCQGEVLLSFGGGSAKPRPELHTSHPDLQLGVLGVPPGSCTEPGMPWAGAGARRALSLPAVVPPRRGELSRPRSLKSKVNFQISQPWTNVRSWKTSSDV